MPDPTPRDLELAQKALHGIASTLDLFRAYAAEGKEPDEGHVTPLELMIDIRATARAEGFAAGAAQEREACCACVCTYCKLAWPFDGGFHKNPGGNYASLREYMPCRAIHIRQGAPHAE